MADLPAARAPLASVHGFPAPGGPIDLRLDVGDILQVRGANGSGKTSLLRSLAGLDAARRPATVQVQGSDPRLLPARLLSARVRAVWASPRATLVGLTVAGEFRLRGTPLPPDLLPWADRDVPTLSAGEAQRVALAVAQASGAPLLLLDEPAASLDAAGLRTLRDLVLAAARTGGVVLVDHSGAVAALATRTLDLTPPLTYLQHDILSPDGPAAVVATPRAVRLGRTPLSLPAVRAAPGLTAVTGRNGAGKTTLLRRLAGLADSGEVTVAGQPPVPGGNVRFLQADAGDLLMAATVRDEIAGVDDAGFVPASLLDRHPLSLSAGEAQRVGLAKAFGRPAPLHLLDEPEAHLDADGRERLLAAIAQATARGACVVAATHDAELIAQAAQRIEVGA